MPRPLTPDEWEEMRQLQRSGLPKQGDTPPDAPQDEEQSIPRQLWEGTKGVMEGGLKEAAGFIDPSATAAKNFAGEEPTKLGKWAASDDPAHPYSEPVGRFGADMIPSAFTPDLPILAAANAAKMMGPILRHPKAAKAIIDTTQRGWKGAVGDWEQGGSGATGATTAAGLPIAARGMEAASKAIPGVAIAADLLHHATGHMSRIPFWALYPLPSALHGFAKWTALNPGVEGAAAERFSNWLGGVNQEPANGPPENQ